MDWRSFSRNIGLIWAAKLTGSSGPGSVTGGCGSGLAGLLVPSGPGGPAAVQSQRGTAALGGPDCSSATAGRDRPGQGPRRVPAEERAQRGAELRVGREARFVRGEARERDPAGTLIGGELVPIARRGCGACRAC